MARRADRHRFFESFTTRFFTAEGKVKVTEQQCEQAVALCEQPHEDLPEITVPTLGPTETVPFEGSGKRTHEAIAHSELVVLAGAPHGCDVSHADEHNRALLDFRVR